MTFVRLPAAVPGAEPPGPARVALALTWHEREILRDVAQRGRGRSCWINAETLSHVQLLEAGLIAQTRVGPFRGGRWRWMFRLTGEGEKVWQALQQTPAAVPPPPAQSHEERTTMPRRDPFPSAAPRQDAEPKRWLPAEHQDEVIPAPRDRPEDWLFRMDDGAWALAGPDDDNPTDRCIPVAAGDIVTFQWTEDFGAIRVTVRPDGSFVAHQQPHPDATMFCLLGNTDFISTSLEEFAQSYAEAVRTAGGEMPEYELVECYRWSDDLEFRVVLDPAGGTPRLEPLPAAARA